MGNTVSGVFGTYYSYTSFSNMRGKITRRLVAWLILAGTCKVIGKGARPSPRSHITQLSDPFAERP
jgi:hypothetical protein